jgi:hypothetical protein
MKMAMSPDMIAQARRSSMRLIRAASAEDSSSIVKHCREETADDSRHSMAMTRCVAVALAAALASSILDPAAASASPTRPILEIDKLDRKSERPQQTMFTETVHDKVTRTNTGKLDAHALAQAKADLAAAMWKQTTVRHCMAFTTASTVYTVGGKVVFTARMCNPVTLDDASAKARDDLDTLLATAWPPPVQAPTPAPAPPP